MPAMDSSTAAHTVCPSTALSGALLLVSKDARVPVASLFINVPQIASAKSPRALMPSVEDSYSVVPEAGSIASSAVPLSQGSVSTIRRRASSDVPLGHGLN